MPVLAVETRLGVPANVPFAKRACALAGGLLRHISAKV
jgi:hypothetical protein